MKCITWLSHHSLGFGAKQSGGGGEGGCRCHKTGNPLITVEAGDGTLSLLHYDLCSYIFEISNKKN